MNAATDYVKAGLALVPLRPGTKKPLKDDWTLKENAVTTTAQAKKLNGGLGLAHAWSGTCAFDIDDFFATIDWFQEHGIDVAVLLQHPAAVKIDSGRQNRAKLLYRLPDGVSPPLTIKHLMPNGATMFELRCANSSGNSVHCVLPPSIHPDTGKPYKWVGDWHNIPVIPEELLSVWSSLIANHQRRTGDRPKAVSPEDLSDQTLIDLDSALATIPADSRETWIAVGHALKGLGEYGYQLWLAWSRKSSAYRPGDEERWDSFDPKHTDYRAIFSRASRDHEWVNPGYRWEDSPGGSSGGDKGETGAGADFASLFVGAHTFIQQAKAPVWLLDGIIQRGYLYSMTAQTGHGKTALASVLAISVAMGKRLGSIDVQQGCVLYFCGENPADFMFRLSGAATAMGVDPVNLEHSLKVFPIADRLAAISMKIIDFTKEYDDVALIIIDTSIAYFSYLDENNNIQARDHAQDLRRLVDANGHPAVLALSHPIKNATKDNLVPRGGSGFLNEVDGNLTIWKEDEIIELCHNKVRGPNFDPISFSLKKVPVPGLLDKDGKQFITMIAMPISDSQAFEAFKDNMAYSDQLLVVMLIDNGGSIFDWATRLGWLAENGTPHKGKIHRLLKILEHDKLVVKNRNGWGLTRSGSAEADRLYKK